MRNQVSTDLNCDVEINRELKQGVVFEILKQNNYSQLKSSSQYKIVSIKKRKITFLTNELDKVN